MTIKRLNLCDGCVHKERKGYHVEALGDLSCKAFPDRIPKQYQSGEAGHTSVVEGQVGTFVFEPKGPRGQGIQTAWRKIQDEQD